MAVSLVAAGADPNLAADEAFTPIFAAAVRGDRELVEILLYSGADPVPDVREGVLAPADAARGAGHDEVADLLEQASQ